MSAALALVAITLATPMARAGDLDLDDDDGKKSDTAKPDDKPWTPPIATIRPHAYSLDECLSLTDRNHPSLWAARARLAAVHGQLDEARYQPFSYWNASARFGVLPPLGGTPFYNAVPRQILNEGVGSGYQPFLQFSFGGSLPLYTFGKIDAIKRAAESQVRYSEWDMERERQQVRFDVRRAYYGLMLAHDAMYIGAEVLDKINKSLENVIARLDKGDAAYDDADRIRLEINRDELLARIGEAKKGEALAVAALRFFTGVQTAFEIPDEPLKRPDQPLGPVVRYLTAARLFRPDVNRARSGVAARRALVDFARAQLLPNIGVGLQFSYNVAPSATPQNTAWIGDPFNGFGAGFAFGLDWGLDILPKQGAITQAEAALEEARALERLALGGVAVEVEGAYASAVEAKNREETWEHAEHRAKKWILSVQDAIDLGTKDERFLLEPLRAYVYARAFHAQALMDFNLALADLARVTGWDQPLN